MKNPMKSNNDIKEIYNQKLNSYLLEEEWKNIIMQIYENDDIMNLQNKIIDFIRKKGPSNNKLETSDR